MNMCRNDIDLSCLQTDISYLDDIEDLLSESEYQIIDSDVIPTSAEQSDSNKQKHEIELSTIQKNSQYTIEDIPEIVTSEEETGVDYNFIIDDDIEGDISEFWAVIPDETDVFEELPSGSIAKTISKDEKALQVAINFVSEKDLDPLTIDFFEEVFITFGYGKTKRALSERLDAGHSVEELEAAFWVKSIWTSCSQFGLSFREMKDRRTSEEYKHCSWIQALKLITRLPENLCYEEVLDVMENQFDNWYQSSDARKRYKSFIDYLFMHPHPLKHIPYADVGFVQPVGYESNDTDWLNQNLHPDSQRLIDYGLYSNRHTELNFEVE
mgnify:CR=1 FL=1